MPAPSRITKSQYLAGLQCLRRLWWERRERDALELVPDLAGRWRLEQGIAAGLAARSYVPRGEYERRVVSRTGLASIDIVEPLALGHVLIEVKSSSRVKPVHLADVAFQWHVAHAGGLPVTRAELMHLNPACRFPDLDRLFIRTDVTEAVEVMAAEVPEQLERQHEALAGGLPDIAPGPHCTDPRPCPFFFRCNPVPADDDVRNLYQIRASRLEDLAARGIDSILALPDEEPLTAVQQRQRSALQAGGLLVGDGLGERLDQIGGAVAFLDFETVATSVPRFQGTRPWENVPAQFSMHRQGADGVLAHTAWMAEGPEDPRPGLAAALVEASAGADQIVVYSAGFEATCLKHLAEAVPERRTELDAIRSRLVDLLPLVRDHLYSPAFRGSFSLKHVLPALIPELDHTTLGVRSGGDASALLGWLTFYPERFSRMERLRRKRQLLDYCALDTLALVRLLGRLRDLALLPGRTA